MSAFTQFDSNEQLEYNPHLSSVLGRDCWRIVKGFRYYVGGVPSNQFVDVPEGYITDGASVPRILWCLIPPIGAYSQATTVHDYLCNTYKVSESYGDTVTQVPVTRKEIDHILFEALKVLGIPKWTRLAIELGVNLYRFIKRPKGPKSKVIISL